MYSLHLISQLMVQYLSLLYLEIITTTFRTSKFLNNMLYLSSLFL